MVILCTIDLETREVSLPAGQVIASYDHNVDVIRFQAEAIPGFSLDTSSIKIAAQGPNKARHDYTVDPSTVAIEEETGYITFDWPIPAGVTEMPLDVFKYGDKGQLIFAVCAEIISGDTVSKAWHSDDGIITVVAHLEPEAGGGEDPSEEATNAQKIGQLQTDVAVVQREVAAVAGGTPTVVDAKADMTEHDKIYILSSDGKWYYYSATAEDWLVGGTYGGATTSTTFTEHGVPADDFAVGQALADKADADDVTALDTRVTALESGSSGGLTADIKSALLACFANVAWAGNDGQDYYDALDAALNPPAGLVSISAVYTQSGTVYDTASLDSLKPDLVVTAHYDNATSEVISNYTLSGMLTEGTSTITVSYGGKTTTFTVTVSVFSTAPVIAEEGKVWASTSASSAPVLYNAAGFGVTETYGCTFSQSNLESSGLYDETNDYMTTNGWSGIKYYISDVNTLADGKSWPSSNRSKHTMIKNDAAIVGWSTITKNAEATWQFSRYISNAAHCDGVSFTIPLLDKDDCYAYWHKPIENAILPDGISEGDIIFAGRNTPYYGCHNISEAVVST